MTRIEDDDVEDEWPRIEPVGSRRRNGVKLKWSERTIRHFYQSQMEQATAQAGGETVIGLVSLAELPPSSRGKWGRGYDIVSKLDFRTDRRRKKVRTKAGAFMQVEATQDRTLPPSPVGRPRKYHGTNAERRVNRYAARTPMKGLPHAATAGTHDNLVGLDSSTDAPVNAKATD